MLAFQVKPAMPCRRRPCYSVNVRSACLLRSGCGTDEIDRRAKCRPYRAEQSGAQTASDERVILLSGTVIDESTSRCRSAPHPSHWSSASGRSHSLTDNGEHRVTLGNGSDGRRAGGKVPPPATRATQVAQPAGAATAH